MQVLRDRLGRFPKQKAWVMDCDAKQEGAPSRGVARLRGSQRRAAGLLSALGGEEDFRISAASYVEKVFK